MTRAVPAGPGDLTPEWLTGVLRRAGALAAGGQVAHVSLEPLSGDDSLSCHVVRLRLSYEGGSDGPVTVVVKLPSADPKEREAGFRFGAYANETRFYTELADRCGVATPACYLAAIDADAQRLAIVLEDLDDGTIGGDGEMNADQIEAALTALARMHGQWWAADELDPYTWLRRDGRAVPPGLVEVLAERVPRFLERFRDRLPARFRAAVESVPDWLPRVVERDPLPDTLIHADASAKNVFFPAGASRGPIFFDWQLVRRGSVRSDLRNLLVESLGTEIRRAAETGLLAAYREALAESGVGVTEETLWLSYRIGVASAVIPCVGNGGREDAPARVAHAGWLLDRVPQAFDDLDIYGLIEA